MDELRDRWKELYSQTLPSLARGKHPSQSKWPVTLDDCFARIILDNTIGKSKGPKGEDVQWDSVLKRPAVRNMTEEQLKEAINLGEMIKNGKVHLVELDRASLKARGKQKMYDDSELKKVSEGRINYQKRGRDEDEPNDEQSPLWRRPKKKITEKQTILNFDNSHHSKRRTSTTLSPGDYDLKTLDFTGECLDSKSGADVSKTLERIWSHEGLTEYRKRVYTALLSIPRGRFTTYATLATYLGSSARAVGNGIRNNPFAPDAPCHRVLASDRTLGGFGGSWGPVGVGKNAEKKKGLLEREGVKFDSTGKAKGPIFQDFGKLSI